MLGLSVSSITKRSMPMPSPQVGGIPCSRAVRKSSSIPWAFQIPGSFSGRLQLKPLPLVNGVG